jgi:hypothetical protein
MCGIPKSPIMDRISKLSSEMDKINIEIDQLRQMWNLFTLMFTDEDETRNVGRQIGLLIGTRNERIKELVQKRSDLYNK